MKQKRSGYCGDFCAKWIGQTITVMGWVQRQRDLGALIFVDLRDRSGLLQLAFDEECAPEVFELARGLRSEFVLSATGVLRERSAKNPEIPTGDVELFVTDLELLSKSETPPFEITEHSSTGELTRLKHRYLDLRRPDLQKNLLMRHKITKITRDYFDEQGFIEIETPMLIRSTPEGARDYLVPSRLHSGAFYALPQSPQMYKQLCMVAGFDRYFQLARCFRDEDLRADRQPEFTQIDLELSFVELEDILNIVEGYIQRLTKALNIAVSFPIPRMTYHEAMHRFGSDKPDTRYGMELWDAGDLLEGCGFSVFEAALETGGVRGITAKQSFKVLSRKEIDKLIEFVKGIGGKGLAWAKMSESGEISSSFGKFLGKDITQEIFSRAGAEKGDVIFLVADPKNSLTYNILGLLRQELAKKLQLISKKELKFLWVTEFPFFDRDEETGEFIAMHHAFTTPTQESASSLESDKSSVIAQAADLTLNGIELSSGSVRITDPELQAKVFSILGLKEMEIKEKFGFIVDAFRYGAPPHGGMGIGLDRLVMQLLGCESLRDVIAFPKVQNASEPMTDCPARVDEAQLRELGIVSFLERNDADA